MPAKKSSKKAVKARKKPPNAPGDRSAFTQRARLFAAEYVRTGNGTQSAIAAGYAEKSAASQACDLLNNPKVAEEVERLRELARKEAGIDGAEVLRRLKEMADADPNELSQVRRVPCRFCYGAGHERQYTPQEWQNRKSGDEDRPPAAWYDKRKPPHPDCPECFGDGEEELFLHDTRNLSPEARRAYAGVSMTKHGPSVKMHDRAAVLVKLGEHAGLFAKKVEVSGKNGGPILTENFMRVEFVEGPGKPSKEKKA